MTFAGSLRFVRGAGRGMTPQIGLWLVLAWLASSSPAADLRLSPSERQWLGRRSVIRFGADPSWPPFSMRRDGELEGIDRNLVAFLEARLGVRFEYLPTESWEETLAKLSTGEIDFVTGVADLHERPLGLRYTAPYAPFPVAMIMREDGPFYTSLERVERAGLVIAGPLGYAPTVFVQRNHPSIELLPTATSLEALRRVSEGRADAVLENLGVAAHLIRLHGLSNLKIAGPTDHRFDPTIGVRQELPELKSILDKGIVSITPQERLEIYDRWIPLEMSRFWSWRQVALAGMLVGIAAAAVIGLVVAWNRRLGRELEMRRAAEESLRRSEERFRHLFESMEDAYFLTQADGRIQFLNEAGVELLGVGSRPVVARLGLANFLRKPKEFERLHELLGKQERLRDQTVEFEDADGAARSCLCQIRLVRDPEGKEVGIEWIARIERPEDPEAAPAAD